MSHHTFGVESVLEIKLSMEDMSPTDKAAAREMDPDVLDALRKLLHSQQSFERSLGSSARPASLSPEKCRNCQSQFSVRRPEVLQWLR